MRNFREALLPQGGLREARQQACKFDRLRLSCAADLKEINLRFIYRIFVPISIFSMGGSHVLSAAPTAGNACSFFTQTQMSAALGVAVDAGHHIGPGNALCGWNQPGDPSHTGKGALLTIYHTVGKLTPVERFENGKLPVQGIAKTPVAGIGDDAYYIDTPGLGVGLNVKKGTAVFQMRVYGFSADETKSIESTLAQAILVGL